MSDTAEPLDPAVARLALLADPVRAALHRRIRASDEGVTRDEAAAAIGISRSLAAFHLDRLVDGGLARVTYERRNGRSGPGAGRPAKIYRPAPGTVSASVPPRRYDVAADLLALAVERHVTKGVRMDAAVDDVARRYGRELGRAARARRTDRGRAASVAAAVDVLAEIGFEPESQGPMVVLRNCPFDAVAREHRDLVCRMNVEIMDGVLDGLRLEGMTASFEPDEGRGRCCVTWRPTASTRAAAS